MDIYKEPIDKVFDRMTKHKHIHEAVVLVENGAGDFSYDQSYGGKDIDTPLLIASITKLLTTTCIFFLKEQGKLSLDDQVTKYFGEEILNDLHIYKSEDYSKQLTLAHLLYQTSGLPDIFEEGHIKQRVLQQDLSFTFEETIKETKQLSPHFAPQFSKRAHYADVNFDMLGKIIETVTELPLEEVYKQFICEPLGLEYTYLPTKETDIIPKVYYKNRSLARPKSIKSIRASGGAVSTARELMIFIKAFFNGKLFHEKIFHKLSVRNKLQLPMYPIRYGAGYMIVPLSGLATLFMGKGELIGHSGSSGSFAFYEPQKDLFFVGDINQMANPALPVRLAMRLAIAIKA